jgi:hypothetical protein
MGSGCGVVCTLGVCCPCASKWPAGLTQDGTSLSTYFWLRCTSIGLLLQTVERKSHFSPHSAYSAELQRTAPTASPKAQAEAQTKYDKVNTFVTTLRRALHNTFR